MKRTALGAAGGLVLAIVMFASAGRDAVAVEAGLNCETYEDGVCVVMVGDVWFCDESYQSAPCPSSIVVGETVRWVYPADGIASHTSTECGTDCVLPVKSSMWHSGVMNPGDEFDLTFDLAGTYYYYCQIHPFQQGIIRVLEADALVGDVDCGGSINAIDAALVLQRSAALLDELPCAENGDPSGDGVSNSLDAALILQYSAGLIEGF